MRGACLLIVLVPTLCGFTCGHVQEAGPYLYVADEVIEDRCQILADPTHVAQGTLTPIGNELRIDDFTYQGVAMQLVGSYDWNIESFYMDGSAAHATVAANGQPCVIDELNVHFTATTDDATHFHGSLSVNYQAITHTDCQCALLVRYHAVHQ